VFAPDPFYAPFEFLDARDRLTGLQLAISMVRSQFGGSIEFRRDAGLCCIIRFNAKSYGAKV